MASLIKSWLWPFLVFLSTAFLYVIVFAPWDYPEAAYIFAVPLLIWLFYVQSWRRFVTAVWLAFFIGWLGVLIWLRHVTWGGAVVLAGILSCFPTIWAWVVFLVLRKMVYRGRMVRLLGLGALAGLWVLTEWTREFLFSGFPWFPLAVSQWERPALLQVAAWTGYYGVSFVIIFFNLGLACYVLVQIKKLRGEYRPLGWQSEGRAEFYTALILLLGLVAFNIWYVPQLGNQRYFFKAGVVQPYTLPHLKWDQEKLRENLMTLQEETRALEGSAVDLVFWPETAIPSSLSSDGVVRLWVEGLNRELGCPFLVGGLGDVDGRYYNAIFLVTPEEGVGLDFYAKRRRVPLGEYIPWRKYFTVVDKFVPVDFDLFSGESDEPIVVKVGADRVAMGCLVCYEDIFPSLSRSLVRNGAECLMVATNDAWYGEEGGAYQHAAHSVLRAIENRRPVIRVGNGGWSGWMDEYGNVRHVVRDVKGSIYFRGSGAFSIYRDGAWVGRQSFYTQHGDWFIVCLCFVVVFGLFINWRSS